MFAAILSVLVNVTCFFVLLLVITAVYVFIKDFFHPLRKLPGARLKDPFFGILSEAVRRKGRVIELFNEGLIQDGPVKKCYLFLGEIRVMVSDPEWVKYVLISNAKNYSRGNYAGVEFIRKVVGDSSLILISGEMHKRLRRFATPGFKPSLLKSFVPLYRNCASRLIKQWQSDCKIDKTVDVRTGLANVTLDVIGSAAFGYDFHSFGGAEESPYTKPLKCVVKDSSLSLSAVIPFYSQLFNLFLLLAPYTPRFMLRQYKNTVIVHQLVEKIVESRQRHRIRSESDYNENEGSSKPQNLLDFIIAGNEKGALTTSELRDMVMTFVLAGHETSSVAMSWALLILAQNAECQEKCYQEADRVFQSLNGAENLTWDDLKRLEYLTAVIHETLRLYPPVPYVDRCTIADDVIAGYSIPTGTDILITICELHRNPELWGVDAAEFKPERYLEFGSDENGPWQTAFLPFGTGVHKCIGYQFALAEITTILALLLTEFRFSMVPGDVFHEKADITMKPNPPLRLNVELRE